MDFLSSIWKWIIDALWSIVSWFQIQVITLILNVIEDESFARTVFGWSIAVWLLCVIAFFYGARKNKAPSPLLMLILLAGACITTALGCISLIGL